MKKVFLTLASAMVASMSYAQVEQEAIFITGGLNFGSADATLENGGMGIAAKANTFGIKVAGGYMLTDMFGAGLSLGYTSLAMVAETDPVDMGLDTKSNLFMVNIFPRAYIEIDEPLYFVCDLNLGYGFGGNTSQITDGEGGFDDITQKYTAFDFNISPGFSYFFTDMFALDMRFGYIGYNGTTVKIDMGDGSESKATSGGFAFNTDLSTLRLGITLMFNN